MSARALLLGLDGLDPSLVRALGPSRMPHLHALGTRGVLARLESVRPAATLPNWTTLLTGVDPGCHGVFDFTVRRGYAVQFTGGTVRQVPTLATRLDRLGLRCACVGFPATWPPERLEHGVFVSGWDSPVAFEADRSFVWPPALWDEMRARFGTVRFDDVDELDAESPGWHARLPDALCARVARKTELAEWLLRRGPWDLFAFYFGESDTAAHYLWSLCDPASPRRPPGVSAREAGSLGRVYAALDEAVGRLVARAGGDAVEVTVASDHGAGGSSDRVLYLNRALADAGLCGLRGIEHLSAQGWASRDAPGYELEPGDTVRWMTRLRRAASDLGALHARAAATLRDRGPRALPPAWRDRAFRWVGRRAPGWLESRARFGAIDFRRTTAFSDELNYFPSVHLNVRGREPNGTVPRSALERARREVIDALLALRDPWDGAAVVHGVYPREALYEGPWVERAPDLVLELALPGGHSYNLMPSGGAPPGCGAWRRLGPEEYLGRKGRSLPGSHRAHGVLVLAGPSVRPLSTAEADALGARMADVTATLLARLGCSGEGDHRLGRAGALALAATATAGRVLWEALRFTPEPPEDRDRPDASADVTTAATRDGRTTVADEAMVEARLRALGYID